MFRKLVFRLFAGCFTLFLIVVLAVGFCLWLLFAQPPAYAQLREQTFTQQHRDAVNQKLEDKTNSIEDWVRQKVQFEALKRASGADRDGSEPQEEPGQLEPSDLPADSLTSLVLSQDDLNAILSAPRYQSRDLRNVRVQILQDRVRLAAEIALSDSSSIVTSADFRLTKMPDRELKLELLGGSLGRLPIPVVWLLHQIPDTALPHDEKIEFHLSDPVPHLLLKVAGSSSDPDLKQIRIHQQSVVLDFDIPVIAF